MTEKGITIVLEEQNHIFALDKKAPVRGKVVLEKQDGTVFLQVRVRNLQPRQAGDTYQLMMLGRNQGRSAHKLLGSIPVNGAGNGAAAFQVNEDNADGEGSGISCFFIFMVAAMPQQIRQAPMQAVLKGDRKREQIWEERRKATFNTFYMTYVKEQVQRLQEKFLPETEPFEESPVNGIWKRGSCLEDFPVASVEAADQIRRYGHFIFCCTEEFCIVGVPGQNTEADQPDRGESGFLLWKPIRGSVQYGYWLAAIQRNTGIITEFP